MSERPSPAAVLAAEIAAVASLGTSLVGRAEALLEPLRAVLEFDAACITMLDAEGRRQPPLLWRGYPSAVVEHLHSTDFFVSVQRLGFSRNRSPLRLADMPVPPGELRGWAEFMAPAGFGEGIGIPLHTADGRYLGVLSTHTEDRKPVRGEIRDLLGDLAPLIAYAVDPLRTITALAALVTDAVAGVMLTRTGATAPLPGLPRNRLLDRGSPVVTEAAACYADGDSRATFLTPTVAPDPPGYLRATMLACPDQSPYDLEAVVMLRPPGDLHHLSHREMTVLGLFIAGRTECQAAARLRTSVRAVRAALEHARVKLGAPTNAAAIMRAADLGLYLPPTQRC
ncbi:LuxR C-terminal-related transcriptional regulator [Actinoplanes sp. NPDC051346]|uniref:helix-turn-helix transcriptional regulator n=1 Tax=Actinoplanes sp. NPDC051346 TaxID=3155048 RepID=UPI0034259B01